jgi:hypothetical protein
MTVLGVLAFTYLGIASWIATDPKEALRKGGAG